MPSELFSVLNTTDIGYTQQPNNTGRTPDLHLRYSNEDK